MDRDKQGVSRRNFIKTTSAALGAASFLSGRAWAAGSDTIRVGLVGCGGRGCSAGIIDCAMAAQGQGLQLVAIADLFEERVKSAPERIKKNLKSRNLPVDDIYKVTPETTFVGWDACDKLLKCDLDLVILTNPPFFRPMQFKAAVDAGKHVFAEKPVAVDPVGVRSFIETAELAKQKGLCLVAGTQMRRAKHIMATIQKIHDGAMGDVVAGQVVRCGDGMLEWGSPKEKPAGMSDMEYQIRRWLFMTWLSGDFIVEMHVHNLDLLNWAMGSTPTQCFGFGGRTVRTAPEYGNVYDMFTAEFEYPNGARIEYIGTQIEKAHTRNDLRFSGTRGKAYIDFGDAYIEGDNPFKYEGERPEPAITEYADLLDAIRNNKQINEGRQVAESTMTAIMARTCAYTGRALKWDWLMNSSKLDLSPKKLEFGDNPLDPVPQAGITQLV